MAPTTPERGRAEAIFKARQARKADAPKATQDYQAAQQATLDRTKKLREERLERETTEKALNKSKP